MPTIGSGKLCEGTKVVKTFGAARPVGATIYYNGISLTAGTADMIDTQDFDDAVFVANVGAIVGPVTLINTVLESATNSMSAATAVSGASFTQRNTANGSSVAVGAVQCKKTKRFLALKTEVQGTPATIDFAGVCILGSADSQDAGATLEFDV